MAKDKRQALEVLWCPECKQPFELQDGVRFAQDGFPAVWYDRSDCLLDAREKRNGRDPRWRWPKLTPRFWRGKEIR